MPEGKSFEEAATWPLTFATAYQSLVRTGQLKSGQAILIQDASSGIGQAAIQIALAVKAKVFTTARSEAESRFIED